MKYLTETKFAIKKQYRGNVSNSIYLSKTCDYSLVKNLKELKDEIDSVPEDRIYISKNPKFTEYTWFNNTNNRLSGLMVVLYKGYKIYNVPLEKVREVFPTAIVRYISSYKNIIEMYESLDDAAKLIVHLSEPEDDINIDNLPF